MSTLNEVEFAAEVKSWVEDICRSKGESFPFSRASIEKREKGKTTRRDFVIWDRQDKRALTGEIKLPDRIDGRNPYSEDLVLDAQRKADAVGVAYFFTWNVNRMVLWKAFVAGMPISDRSIEFFDWASVRDSDELSRPEVTTLLKKKWDNFLTYFAEIHRGKRTLPRCPLERKFVHYLESALEGPANLTRARHYTMPRTKTSDSPRRCASGSRRTWVASSAPTNAMNCSILPRGSRVTS